jgi:hypothetical protein
VKEFYAENSVLHLHIFLHLEFPSKSKQIVPCISLLTTTEEEEEEEEEKEFLYWFLKSRKHAVCTCSSKKRTCKQIDRKLTAKSCHCKLPDAFKSLL